MTQAPFQGHFLTSLGLKKPGQVTQQPNLRKSREDPFAEIIAKYKKEAAFLEMDAGVEGVPLPEIPICSTGESDENALLKFGELATLEHLPKELDVESKLQSKIDRLFKRFFQLRAMKQIAGLAESTAPRPVESKPILELAAAREQERNEE